MRRHRGSHLLLREDQKTFKQRGTQGEEVICHPDKPNVRVGGCLHMFFLWGFLKATLEFHSLLLYMVIQGGWGRRRDERGGGARMRRRCAPHALFSSSLGLGGGRGWVGGVGGVNRDWWERVLFVCGPPRSLLLNTCQVEPQGGWHVRP